VNPHAIPQSETADDFGGNENVLRSLNKIPFRVAKETEAFSRDFDDSVTEFWFIVSLPVLGWILIWALLMVAISILAVGADRSAIVLGIDSVGWSVEIAPLWFFRSAITWTIVPSVKASARAPWAVWSQTGFGRSLVISFFAHNYKTK